jgi:CBS domain-containing protein
MKVSDVMSERLFTATPDMPLRLVAERLLEYGISECLSSTEDAKAIEAFVDRVPGVVGVVSRLHWENGK